MYLQHGCLLTAVSLCLSVQMGWSGDARPWESFQATVDRLLSLTAESIQSERDAVVAFEELESVVRSLAKVEDYETMLKLARKGRELFPTELRSGVLLGWALGMAAEVETAISTTRAAIAEKAARLPDPEGVYRAEGLTNLGGFLIQLGNFRDSLEYLEQARKANPNAALPDYLAGLAHRQLEDEVLCARAYEKAFRKDPELASPGDYVFHAWAEDRMGHLAKAGEILGRAVKRYPAEMGLHVNLGLNKEAQSATREAYYEHQLEVLIGEPDSPYSTEARKRIERIERKQLATSFPDPELKAVVLHLRAEREGKKEEAAKLLEKAVELSGLRHPYLLSLYTRSLVDQGDYQMAIGYLEGALASLPDDFFLEVDLARAYARAGMTEKADELIAKLMLVAPNNAKLKQLIGPMGEGK